MLILSCFFVSPRTNKKVNGFVPSLSGSVSMDEVHTACHDAENGLPSRRPVIEMTIPSTLDNTISPPGTHILPH